MRVSPLSSFICGGVLFAAVAALALQASAADTATMPATAITAVTKNLDSVGKYAKLELSVKLTGNYTNPYDPDQIDLSAEFTAPSKKVWKVNGFFDGTGWKVRFAANEVGNWTYTVSAKDATGTIKSPAGTFACAESKNHGWVKVADNKRYLSYDDGTSFYGVGCCHAWGVSTNTLDQMKALGFNTYVYWNGTYDQGGGNALIESMQSGLGKYDQRKCARLDTLIDWNEARDMTMVLVILPHDYACENMGGWPAKWVQYNPYQTITTSDKYYSDEKSWEYQQKQYRYIIARWGYSRGISSWQTVDEISGTSGWKNQASANAWAGKIGEFFQTHDPFKHPTTASHGGFWDPGNKVNDLPNTEIYGNYSTQNIISTVQKLWNGYEKPCIMGETGAEGDGPTCHRKIWAGLASGISVTPLLWQFTQGWSPAISAQYPAFNKFIADIDFAHLKKPAQAKVTLVGPRTPSTSTAPATAPTPPAPGGRGGRGANNAPLTGAWGITSEQITFGWMSGEYSGKTLSVAGLAAGSYDVQWWNTNTGAIISTEKATVAGGPLTAKIPTTTQLDIAFKIVAPGAAKPKAP